MLKSILTCIILAASTLLSAQQSKPKFNIIAFYTAKNDQAHISFVHEANQWFSKIAKKYRFSYDSTANWDNLNAKFLAKYQVVIFLDTRPEKPEQRAAFQTHIENGGAWMGFHFSAFALAKSAYDTNWDWYHNTFLGSGAYASNTWRPTSAILRVENGKHPITKKLPQTFKAQPNEWYRWQNDLRKNPDINILLSIDSTSFPLGTGPKQHEIWTSGYYPVVWSNKNFKMVYINMGHNDIDYEHKYGDTEKTLSQTFGNKIQNQMILNCLMWLGSGKQTK
ncbi:ThuA domain-containing protein [Pedobacter endophyticus]|uniref:ThuA domain-containing protein n=1 Tax=Pedobacter endophyticus TaxID=2789740 RepID=A0A7S9L211_9SPHI|nr:ThuA domain-containing protein [Pedobacter endophyticus]QPH41007.1 ThuA domain-containing protein [Pedobacter endophyticus]